MLMRYPIAIEPGTSSTAYGVVVPDLPGCFSAGDTLEEALAAVEEAAAAWIDAALDAGEAVPPPSTLDSLRDNPDYQDWVFGVVIYTGKESKLMLNRNAPKFKFSKFEQILNKFVIQLFLFNLLICLMLAAASVTVTATSTEDSSKFGTAPLPQPGMTCSGLASRVNMNG